MSKALKTVQKRIQKGNKTDTRAKKLGLIPGVDSPYQWLPVGDTQGTNKESF